MTETATWDPVALERMISHCCEMMVASKEHDQQIHWWNRMGYYLKKRTPETIRAMEKQKGLA